jgi:hypothetical protein
MPRYARFDPSEPEPHPVTGWYDTDAFDYTRLPPAAELLVMTQEQWDERMRTRWVVRGGKLAPA